MEAGGASGKPAHVQAESGSRKQAAAVQVDQAAHHIEALTKEAPQAEPMHRLNRTNATAGCSAADEKAMASFGGGNKDGTFPKIMSQCGHNAYSWFRWHKDRMHSCIMKRIGISSSCASCFAASGQYGYDHCKLQCLFGSWCSHSCLDCTSPNNDNVKSCAGAVVPTVSYC